MRYNPNGTNLSLITKRNCSEEQCRIKWKRGSVRIFDVVGNGAARDDVQELHVLPHDMQTTEETGSRN